MSVTENEVVHLHVVIRQLPADRGKPLNPEEVRDDIEAILLEEGYVGPTVELGY